MSTSKEQTWPTRKIQEEVESLVQRTPDGLGIRDFVERGLTPKEFERLYLQEPTPTTITHNGDIYVRKDVVEHIIRGSFGPQEALTKIRSL